jgi:hypothetical protein
MCLQTHSYRAQDHAILSGMKCAVNHLRLVALATVLPSAALAQGWTQTSAQTKNWQAIAMSADGSKLVAAISGGGIYSSTNFGDTWISNTAPAVSWTAVASSADGTRMAASYLGGIYTSTNGGMAWSSNNVPAYYWYSVACSADGTLLAAISPTGNRVTISTNFGGSWTSNAFPTGIYDGNSVGLSANGNRLASGNNVGTMLISTNLGVSWSVTNHLTGTFKSIAVSADGMTLATVFGGGVIYSSTNGGVSWSSNSVSTLDYTSISGSADGRNLVAVGGLGSVAAYAFSTNSGASWTTNSQAGPTWRAVASSADGNCLAAAAYGGGIWLLRTVPTSQLNISFSASLAKLSWTIPSTNFVLQQSVDLQNWSGLAASPALNLVTLRDEVMVMPTNAKSFYRLTTP